MAAVDDLVPTFVLLFPLPLAELSYTAPQRLHNFPAVLLWVNFNIVCVGWRGGGGGAETLKQQLSRSGLLQVLSLLCFRLTDSTTADSV